MQRRRMIMDYTARYGLEFNPFLKNSKEVLVKCYNKVVTEVANKI